MALTAKRLYVMAGITPQTDYSMLQQVLCHRQSAVHNNNNNVDLLYMTVSQTDYSMSQLLLCHREFIVRHGIVLVTFNLTLKTAALQHSLLNVTDS